MTAKKKLIEVSLPLEAINIASAREKSIRHGHPSTLHLWWARRPLAAARAVIFAQMVDDPSSLPELFPTEQEQHDERERLFEIIRKLVLWENTTNEAVLEAARAEIRASWRRTCTDEPHFDPDKLPAFHDPFAGGGALPLEAQRLGLESYASDLNPVAVLINKAMIEIPPKFAGRPPVNPEAREKGELIAREWKGAQGLAEDVRYYGQWMRDEAEKRIGHLYPKIEVTAEMSQERPDLKPYVGQKLTVIAWLWARTVKSPNPAFGHVDVPLASTFVLSSKPGKAAWVEPWNAAVPAANPAALPAYRFTIRTGPEAPAEAKNGTKLARANFVCLMSGTPISGDYIKAEGNAGRMGAKLMAIVAEGNRGRVYLAPTPEHEEIARSAQPTWRPEGDIATRMTGGNCTPYGLTTWGDLFTPRQLVALTTFSDLVTEAREKVLQVLRASGPPTPHTPPHTPHTPTPPKGWHSRGYHPHFDQPGLIQSITFRLHDSVPAALVQQWREELDILSNTPADDERQARLREMLDKYEDAGHGACHLRQPEIAALVENALRHFDGERYRLLEYCIMPNHVHVLVETVPGHTLSDVVQSWKSFTAKKANQILGQTGKFWMADYFDRYIRNEDHLTTVRRYIRENPVKAGLCERAEEWRFGSAWVGTGARASGPHEGEEQAGTQAGTRASGPHEEEEQAGTRAGTRASGPHEGEEQAGGLRSHDVAYAEAVATYLAFAVDKGANYWSSICSWHNGRDTVTSTFGRQAIPMVWDYAEANPFSRSSGNISAGFEQAAQSLLAAPASLSGLVSQSDATTQSISRDKVISTDPPYYDNIGYADLSDFFYVWLRRSLRPIYPDLFATLAVPKAEELVATPYRHGGKEKAEAFFLDGMTQAMGRLAEQTHPAFPVTIYYAFKQSESETAEGTSSTGWETFLDAVIRAGFATTGTWPMRTEYTGNLKKNIAALASSIVLVCRKRAATAPTATRREFLAALKGELPTALRRLQEGNIAPVDLAQASIGPGMGVYTRYGRVLDAEGKPVSVREALALINQVLDETLAEQEGDFDADSRFAIAWFEQHGFAEGDFGVADVLARAKVTSVSGLAEAGILDSRRGKVRLLKASELPADWDPAADKRLTHWEIVHHLIRALESSGETAAAKLVAALGARAEPARELAYRLYSLCERKKRAAEALSYNALVQSFPEITRLAREGGQPESIQNEMFSTDEE